MTISWSDDLVLHLPEGISTSLPSPGGQRGGSGKQGAGARGSAKRTAKTSRKGSRSSAKGVRDGQESRGSLEAAEILDGLADADLTLEYTIPLSADEGAEGAVGERTRGGAGTADGVEMGGFLDLTVKDGENAIVLLEEDGAFRWVWPEELPSVARRSRGRSPQQGAQILRFDLAHPGALSPRTTGDRSLFGKVVGWVFKKATAYVLKFVTEKALEILVKKLEQKVDEGLVHMTAPDVAKWVPVSTVGSIQVAKKDPKILFFVHGTFSSTAGSYGALAKTPFGKVFLEGAFDHYDAVFGFDHRTLSETPIENAMAIVKAMNQISWNGRPTVDAIAFSRGGLVLRCIIEGEVDAGAWNPDFRRAVFVGATNHGTELANPNNWEALADLYTNLAAGASKALALVAGPGTGGVFALVVRGVGILVKYLAQAAIRSQGVPGLAAMDPGSDFVKRINKVSDAQPKAGEVGYYIVQSDFEASLTETPGGLPGRLLKRILDGAVDQLMQSKANDLVVDTYSMAAIDVPGGRPLVVETADYGPNPVVYHLVYFMQERTVEALSHWLEVPSDDASRGARRSRRTKAGTGDYPQLVPTIARAGKAAAPPLRRGVRPSASKDEPKTSVHIEVLWGDVKEASGDVFSVGHYINVLPQHGEAALDELISKLDPASKLDERDYVLRRLTKERMILGELGEIRLFPIPPRKAAATESEPTRSARSRAKAPSAAVASMQLVAVCGMGHAGSFTDISLRQLYQRLFQTLSLLPETRELSTLLIGSGDGGLDVRVAVQNVFAGLAAARDLGHDVARIAKIRIVEVEKAKAEKIDYFVRKFAKEEAVDLGMKVSVGELAKCKGRYLRSDTQLASILAATLKELAEAKAGQDGGEDGANGTDGQRGKKGRKGKAGTKQTKADVSGASEAALIRIAECMDPEAVSEAEFAENVETVRRLLDAGDHELNVRFGPFAPTEGRDDFPTRVSFVREGEAYRISMITPSTTIPERVIDLTTERLDQLVLLMTDPDIDEVPRLGEYLAKLIVPRDFRESIAYAKMLVFEVDRHCAQIHWEMLSGLCPGGNTEPLATDRIVCRQLRTTYSRGPGRPRAFEAPGRALVVGDPASRADALPMAREEALRVAKALRGHGFEVDLYLGPRGRASSRAQAASVAEIHERLLLDEYDIVHYSGHADFDPEDPRGSGWLFHDGILDARDIARIESPPRLVFANACLSARTSMRTRTGVVESDVFGESGLAASFADEFLRLGTSQFIGTAWPVSDEGAGDLAVKFYDELIRGATVGKAVLEARKLVRASEDSALWAAYQHYGDPQWILTD